MISDSTFYITLKVIKLSSLNLKAWLSAIAKWDNWDIIAISWDQRSGDQLLSNIKHSNTLLHKTAITAPVHAAQPSSKESTSYGSPAAQRYEQPNQDMSIKASSSTAEDQCMLPPQVSLNSSSVQQKNLVIDHTVTRTLYMDSSTRSVGNDVWAHHAMSPIFSNSSVFGHFRNHWQSYWRAVNHLHSYTLEKKCQWALWWFVDATNSNIQKVMVLWTSKRSYEQYNWWIWSTSSHPLQSSKAPATGKKVWHIKKLIFIKLCSRTLQISKLIIFLQASRGPFHNEVNCSEWVHNTLLACLCAAYLNDVLVMIQYIGQWWLTAEADARQMEDGIRVASLILAHELDVGHLNFGNLLHSMYIYACCAVRYMLFSNWYTLTYQNDSHIGGKGLGEELSSSASSSISRSTNGNKFASK